MFTSTRLTQQIRKIVNSGIADSKITARFLKRLDEGFLTREENPLTHFCVYFAAHDPVLGQVFLGHHIKCGLWLFNGGHLEKGETAKDALEREIKEEWGSRVKLGKISQPQLLTLTKIQNPQKQICRWHYDIWYFFPLDKKKFFPDDNLLAKEFYQIGWKSLAEARKLTRDPNTLIALGKIGEIR